MQLNDKQFQTFLDSLITISSKCNSVDKADFMELAHAIGELKQLLTAAPVDCVLPGEVAVPAAIPTFSIGEKVATIYGPGEIAAVGEKASYAHYANGSGGGWHNNEELELLPADKVQVRSDFITAEEILALVTANHLDWMIRTNSSQNSLIKLVRDCIAKQNAITAELNWPL